jgi:WD40 repeat protein
MYLLRLVKVWDYQNKACVQTLEGHTNNVTVVCFHPELPIIVSGSEDGNDLIFFLKKIKRKKNRYNSYLACQYLSLRKHAQLWDGASLGFRLL